MSADDWRRRGLVALREIYVEAEKDVKEGDAAVRPHRRGVLEGIRRAAFKLFGLLDEEVVTKGVAYIGDRGAEAVDSEYRRGLRRAQAIATDLCRCNGACQHDDVVRSITEELSR